jgi:hypothetical protein
MRIEVGNELTTEEASACVRECFANNAPRLRSVDEDGAHHLLGLFEGSVSVRFKGALPFLPSVASHPCPHREEVGRRSSSIVGGRGVRAPRGARMRPGA